METGPVATLFHLERVIEEDGFAQWNSSYLQFQIKRVEASWEVFQVEKAELLAAVAGSEEKTNDIEGEVFDMSCRVEAIAETLRARLKAINDGEVRPAPTTKIVLSEFSGKLKDWSEWRKEFEAKILGNEDLTPDYKSRALRASLKGVTLEVLGSHVGDAQVGLEKAWQALVNAYATPTTVGRMHMASIMDYPMLEDGSSSELKKLINHIGIQLDSLKEMNYQVEKSNVVFGELILRKVGPIFRTKWENSHSTWPKASEVLIFMNAQVDLEASEISPSVDNRQRATVPPLCRKCKVHHFYWYCDVFKSWTLQRRTEEVDGWGLCPNCLIGDHTADSCPESGCTRCSMAKHNNMLCPLFVKAIKQPTPTAGEGFPTRTSS